MASYSAASSSLDSTRRLRALQSTGPTINLCLLLPKALVPDGKVDLDLSNWIWVHALVLPVDRLASLSFVLKPYKWIRFVAGAILSAHGHLSWSPDSAGLPVDHDAPLPTESQTIYYHCDDEERALMFPVDPHMVKDVPDVYTCDPQFRFNMEERDGGKCVVTGAPSGVCRAVHVVLYRKGNAYIKELTSRRAEDGHDVIVDIEDERNGILLISDLKDSLGFFFGLMKTPNFALTTCDVDPNANDPDEERVSVHVFKTEDVRYIYPLPNGSRVRVPTGEDAKWWPPECLLKASYGSAVLKMFGVEDARKHISQVWGAQFYPDGPPRDEDDGHRRSPSPVDVDMVSDDLASGDEDLDLESSGEDLGLGSRLVLSPE